MDYMNILPLKALTYSNEDDTITRIYDGHVY